MGVTIFAPIPVPKLGIRLISELQICYLNLFVAVAGTTLVLIHVLFQWID